MPLNLATVEAAIATVVDPGSNRPLVELDVIRNLEADGDTVSLVLELADAEPAAKETLEAELRKAITGAGAKDVALRWAMKTVTRPIGGDDPCPGVKNIILVISGKGGVGKSTCATNIALALKRAGNRVGLLDADMYGPSIPTMLGVSGRPAADKEGRIRPLERFGVKLMSLGFLLESEKTAVIWRGPMLQGALMQFVKDVEWGELEYLVLDLPPGTGDVALTLSQRVVTTGAVVVTTPQDVALADVYKSVAMLQKVNIPILGVVENESHFECDGCGKRHEIFGSGGGKKVASFAEAPLLGQIPLDPSVREWSDAGTPVVQAAPQSKVAEAFREVAERMAEQANEANAKRAPKIAIDRSGGTNRHLPIAR